MTRAFIAAVALLLVAAGAPIDRADEVNGTFNAHALDGLNAAQRWRADACLSEAWMSSRPGYEDAGHAAGGEYYEFLYYSASTPLSFYHYRPPFQPSEKGDVESYDRTTVSEVGAAGAAARCIADMPITLRRALKIAQGAGVPMAPDLILEAGRARYDPESRDRILPRVPLGREIWLVLSCPFDKGIGAVNTPRPFRTAACKHGEISYAALDARSGKVLVSRRAASGAVDARR